MASETTFDPGKWFSHEEKWEKGPFGIVLQFFKDWGKRNFLFFYFELTGLQDPCAKNCFLWGRWNWNPFLRIRELDLLSVEWKIFVQQMQTRWTLSKKVGKINLIPVAMSSHGALETIVVSLKTLGALRSPHHSSPFSIIFLFRWKFRPIIAVRLKRLTNWLKRISAY